MPSALEPLTVPEHVEAPVEPGRACLTMATTALNPRIAWSSFAEGIDLEDAAGMATAAIRCGFHAVLYAPAQEDAWLDRARAAGVLHHRTSPGVRHVTGVLEAGHPAIVLVDRALLHQASPAGPHWILLLRGSEDEATYHDPFEAQGPASMPWEELSEVMGLGDRHTLVEIAPPVREDR